MPIQQITRTFEILDTETDSEVIDIPPTYSVVSLIMPDTVTGTSFTVNASAGGSALGPVWTGGSATVAAAAYTINYAASRYIRLTPADFYGMQKIQFVSNVAQAQDIEVIMVLGVLQ